MQIPQQIRENEKKLSGRVVNTNRTVNKNGAVRESRLSTRFDQFRSAFVICLQSKSLKNNKHLLEDYNEYILL